MLTCVSSVSTADGKTDVGVLGSQPGLSPLSPEGEEDPGEDVRVPRHQTVTERQERCSHHQRLVTANGTAPLTLANRRKGKKKRLWMIGQRKLTGRVSDRGNGWRGARKLRGKMIYYPRGDLPSHCLSHLCLRPGSGCAFCESWVVIGSRQSMGAGGQGPLQERSTKIPLISFKQRKLLLCPSKAI